MIEKIEFGLVNDDFLFARQTGKIVYKDGSCKVVKIYDDGRIVDFWDDRYTGGEYEEKELEPSELKDIQNHITGTEL